MKLAIWIIVFVVLFWAANLLLAVIINGVNNTGDAMGVVNSLFSGVALCIIALSLKSQYEELKNNKAKSLLVSEQAKDAIVLSLRENLRRAGDGLPSLENLGSLVLSVHKDRSVTPVKYTNIKSNIPERFIEIAKFAFLKIRALNDGSYPSLFRALLNKDEVFSLVFHASTNDDLIREMVLEWDLISAIPKGADLFDLKSDQELFDSYISHLGKEINTHAEPPNCVQCSACLNIKGAPVWCVHRKCVVQMRNGVRGW